MTNATTRFPGPYQLTSDACVSPCGRYRFWLYRRLGMGQRVMTFIGLNPSTADAKEDDATIIRLRARAMQYGVDVLVVVNLFATRTPKPDLLIKHAKAESFDVIGPDNDQHILRACAGAELVLAGWGANGALLNRAHHVRRMLEAYCVDLMALRLTKAGHPEHPLYLPMALEPFRL